MNDAGGRAERRARLSAVHPGVLAARGPSLCLDVLRCGVCPRMVVIMSRGNIRIHLSIVLCGVSLSVKLPGDAEVAARHDTGRIPRGRYARPPMDNQVSRGAPRPRVVRRLPLSSTLSACVRAGFVFARPDERECRS